jgi:hypothetical protein
LSIATSVYFWLKGQLPSNAESVECEEGVSLNIRDYTYNCTTGLNLTIQNKGRFNTAGFIVRVSNDSTKQIGLYVLNRTGVGLDVGAIFAQNYPVPFQTDAVSTQTISGQLTFVEVQPLMFKKGKLVYCKDVISEQKLTCVN